MSLLSPQLEAFVAIVNQKTVHGAAEQLYLTQTAVTQRIRALETKLHTTLFIRTRRGMALTSEGEMLLRYCKAVLDIEGKTLSLIQGAGVSSIIEMGITGPTSIMRSRILPQCFNLMRMFPSLLMQFDINDLPERVKLLQSGACQFAILQQESILPEMACKSLMPEHYVLVCSSNWKKRKLRDIIEHERIIDFDPSDQMTYNYLKKYDLFHYAKLERHYVNRTDALATMIAEGLGYGVLTLEFANYYVKNKQLLVLNEGKNYENLMALAWYDRPERPPYFKAIIERII